MIRPTKPDPPMELPAQTIEAHSAWNPGIAPTLPRALRPLETIFRPENTRVTESEVADLHDLTGLPEEELAWFRPARLVLHEVIVRVTADIAVAEGEVEEQFGRNFRAIAQAILDRAIAPRMPVIESACELATREIEAAAGRILDDTLFAPPADTVRRSGFWASLLGRGAPAAFPAQPRDSESAIVASFRERASQASDPLERTVYRSLHRVLSAMEVRRGRIVRDRELLLRIASRHAGNAWGSQCVAESVGPLFDAAVAREGFVLVPNREKSILISLKGASASGKSSLRPMIKQLMREQGIEPDGYATISPDVWRRLLLDYDSLGPHYKHAGQMTGRELMVIDGKLDRTIRRKAQRDGAIPHLLVDRFRFDSFESEKVARVLHDTYARYVDTLIMYFVVTPPEETVERGWLRALERGRYKAVEDFLGHSVEAYSGMPKILFKWLANPRPEFRFFFLDNRVPKGTFPMTIAYGTQGAMTVIDPVAFVDIERYQKINIHATSAAGVYPDPEAMQVENNLGFLAACIRKIPRVEFVQGREGAALARADHGCLERFSPSGDFALRNAESLRVLDALADKIAP